MTFGDLGELRSAREGSSSIWYRSRMRVRLARLAVLLMLPSCHSAAPTAPPSRERHDLPVTVEDRRILERAEEILSAEPLWNRADTRECAENATRFRTKFSDIKQVPRTARKRIQRRIRP